MRVVVFTCSTGGGHNACARYIKQEFDDFGITCDVQDYLKLVGDNAAKIIEKLYLDSTKGNGNIFGGVYKLGELYSKTNIPSPVYGLNVLVKEKLDKLFYNIVKEDVKEKVEENVESKNKYYNTKLGTIKVFLIRIAGLETLGENNIFGMIDLSKQYDKEKIYKILEELDVFLAENI